MISDKQLLANQSNAKLGGVKSEEGKSKVRFNAIKHGVWGKLISEYEADLYQDLLTDLMAEIQPNGVIENMIVERIAVAYLRMHRLAKAENEFIRATINPTCPDTSFRLNENGYDPIVGNQAMSVMLDTYARYETSIENQFFRALKELRNHKIGFVLQGGNNG